MWQIGDVVQGGIEAPMIAARGVDRYKACVNPPVCAMMRTRGPPTETFCAGASRLCHCLGMGK